jgi:phosphoribosylformylglycinamidine synthase
MKFIANIDVMPLKVLLDPQGKAVTSSMKNLGFNEVENVRIGKHITLEIESGSEDQARKRILSNPIMEGYEFSIRKI